MNPITKLRKSQHYSQAELAPFLGVSQSAVSQWELGKTLPDIATAQKLAILFGVTIEDLLDSSDYPPLAPATVLRLNYKKLSDEGRKKLLEYSEDLTALEKYQRAPATPEVDHGDD